MIKHLPARTDGYKVEEALHNMYDGEHPVIAVEVFGPESAMAQVPGGELGGPWVLGDRDDVIDYVEGTGYDFETQYTLEHPED